MLGGIAAKSLGARVAAEQNPTPNFNLSPYRAAENQAAAENFSHGSGLLQVRPMTARPAGSGS
jgi:hypothetical protein